MDPESLRLAPPGSLIGISTIHFVRWLLIDENAGTITVHYVKFPDHWVGTARMLADLEHSRTSDWMKVLDDYETLGLIASVTLAVSQR